jgi:hypothetical protein
MKHEFAHLTSAERRILCYDVLNSLGANNVRESGSEIWHSCLLPFGLHANGDRNPACSINFEKMAVNCFVCGGGGFGWWVSHIQGFERSSQAHQWIAKQSVIARDDGESLARIGEFLDELAKPKQTTYRAPLPHYAATVLDPWRFTHPYLIEYRHVPEQTIVDMQVGWNATQSQIIIPHFFKGTLVGWQARNLGNIGPDRPKYKSTPDFPKDRTLYNFSTDHDRPVIVESPMSVLRHRHHCPEIMATFGAQVTLDQMSLAMSRGMHPVLWFDNDLAGWNATKTVGEWMMDRGGCDAVINPYEGDPADLPDRLFEQVLAEHRVPFALWQPPREVVAVPKEEHDGIPQDGLSRAGDRVGEGR